MHDVPMPNTPKIVFDDAITLFPLDMYRANTLSILGTTKDDHSASTASTDPETSDESSISSSEPDNIPATPSDYPSTLPTYEPTNDPSVSPSLAPAGTSPTDMIDEHHVHDYLYDDDD